MPNLIVAEKDSLVANSYATLEEADLYIDDMMDDGGWSALDDDEKTRALFVASKMIDKLRVSYPRITEGRTLKFPVQFDGDDGFDAAKEACIIQSVYLVKYANQIDYAMRGSITGMIGEAYSETNVNRKPSFNAFKKYAPEIYSILSKFINMSVGVFRG